MGYYHKKEQSTDICYNMNETLKYTKQNKPYTKGHLLNDSIYRKYLEQANP